MHFEDISFLILHCIVCTHITIGVQCVCLDIWLHVVHCWVYIMSTHPVHYSVYPCRVHGVLCALSCAATVCDQDG